MVRVNVVSNESEVKRHAVGEFPTDARATARARPAPARDPRWVRGVACTPAAIVVAATDERTLLQSEPRGLRTDELGRVKEQRREVLLPEYWVQDVEGRWYRVSESVWRGAAPGQVVQVCR
jgi:hypothetical protein